MTRVYLPSTVDALRRLQAGETLSTEGTPAHAVSAALKAAYPEADDEELEYAASAEAGDVSLQLLVGLPVSEVELDYRRVVLACDVPEQAVVADPERGFTGVRLGVALARADVASILCDDGAAAVDVRRAVIALQAGPAQDDNAMRLVDAVADHELAWYGTQEIVELVR